MNYIEEEKDNEERNFSNSWWQEHWEKYKVYYLFFGNFFLMLLVVSISNSSTSQQIKNSSDQLRNGDFDESTSYKNSDNSFTILEIKKQDKNWIEEAISEKSVQDKVKTWINNFKYLPPYQTSEGLEIDRHALLYGPPGSGKSFLAEKFAENESAAFFKANFETEIYVGSSGKKLRGTFNQAKKLLKKEEQKAISEKRKSRPVVIIMDELDSFGMKDTSGHDQHTLQEVNGILRMFDEIHNKNLNIVLIGITNYPELLDQALVRVGRFGRQIKVDYPKGDEIEKLINYLEKLLKNGYKYSANKAKWEKDKKSEDIIIEWPANFWSDVRQYTEELRKKYQADKIGFSLRDLQSAVSDCLALKSGENIQKIIPDSSDYKKILEGFLEDKKIFQEKKAKLKNPWWNNFPKPPTNDDE